MLREIIFLEFLGLHPKGRIAAAGIGRSSARNPTSVCILLCFNIVYECDIIPAMERME
jgi:hypothetical protein